jgi:hypothetical protein
MADDKTRAKQLVDRVASSPQKFESRIAEMNYYKKLRDEEFLADKEAGVSFKELQRLYGDLNTYIKRKKREEAMGDSIVDPRDERATKKGGGLLDDDRKMYQDGELVGGQKKLDVDNDNDIDADDFAKLRNQKQEGGPMSMDNQMQMAMNKSEEPMETDNVMEENYTDFIMKEALTEEEETMLTSKLEQDEELAMLFDKVIDVAQEFAGSGPVEGPGSGVSDSIPARLSDGEFVFTAKATEEIGADELMRMMKDAEAAADERLPAQLGGAIGKEEPMPLGIDGSALDNREQDNYTNPLLQPPIRGAGYGR